MEKEVIKEFLGKKVKLVQFPNFVLDGIIEEVFEECLKFRTNTQVSVIDFKAIKEIATLNGDR